MTVSVALLGWAALLAFGAPPALARGDWALRAPRLGIAVWQAVSVSVPVSVVLAGLAPAVPVVPVTTNLAAALRTCVMALEHGYGAPGGPDAALAGVVVAGAVVARSTYCVAGGLARSARERARHVQTLSLVARSFERPGAVILDHTTPAAYCVPGRRRRVVLTSGALRALDTAQLEEVLANEQAHLRGRHHLAIGAAAALERAFPHLPVFAHAREEIARLVEMLADDVAAERHGRLPVAAAMVTIAAGGSPTATLAAGGPGAVERVRRLVAPASPLPSGARLAGFGIALALIFAPGVAAAGPALGVSGMRTCPMAAAMTSSAPGAGCQPTGTASTAGG